MTFQFALFYFIPPILFFILCVDLVKAIKNGRETFRHTIIGSILVGLIFFSILMLH